MAETKKTWADYPYKFDPTKTLTTKEMTLLMKHLFGMKAFPEPFVEGLPKDLKKHFQVRENIHARPGYYPSE